jgi:hypothetical protein
VYPAGQAAVHLNNTVAVLDDFPSDPQTQTPADIFLGSEEGRQDPLDVFGFQSLIGVLLDSQVGTIRGHTSRNSKRNGTSGMIPGFDRPH